MSPPTPRAPPEQLQRAGSLINSLHPACACFLDVNYIFGEMGNPAPRKPRNITWILLKGIKSWMEDDKIMEHKSGLNHGFKTNLRPNTWIAPDSDKLGLVDPHRLLTWVWSTPKQAIPLILF